MARFTTVRSVNNFRNGWHLFRNRKVMLQMMRETLKGHYRISALSLIIIVASVAYVVSPVDIVPDFIPVLGWADDGIVLYLLIKRLVFETQRFTRHKAAERRSGQ